MTGLLATCMEVLKKCSEGEVGQWVITNYPDSILTSKAIGDGDGLLCGSDYMRVQKLG